MKPHRVRSQTTRAAKSNQSRVHTGKTLPATSAGNNGTPASKPARMRRVKVPMPPALAQAVDTAAQQLGISRDEFFARAIQEHTTKPGAATAEREKRMDLIRDSETACDASAGLMFLLSDLYAHPMEGSLGDEGLEGVRFLTAHVTARVSRSFDACHTEADAGRPVGLAVASMEEVLSANGSLLSLLMDFLDRENRVPGDAANGLLHLSWDIQGALEARVRDLEIENAKLREAGKGGAN